MKLEDAKIGTRVITAKGNIATIIGFYPNPEFAKLKLNNGRPSSAVIKHLRLAPTPEEIVEHTLETFTRSTVKQVNP